MIDFDLPWAQIEENKQRIRDVWDYKEVDHIPFVIDATFNPWQYTRKEQYLDMTKQFQIQLETVKRRLQADARDYIPVMMVDVGHVVMTDAFGAEVVYSDIPDQTNTIKEPVITELDQVYSLRVPDPNQCKYLQEGIRRIKYFHEKTDGQILTGSLDKGNPLMTAIDLMGPSFSYLTMYDCPEALDHLLDVLTETHILFSDLLIEAAGGIDNLSCTDYESVWFPEGKKGHLGDDYAATMSPEHFNRFSKRWNNKIFSKYGPGLLHNCGPHPAINEYLWHRPKITGITTGTGYTTEEDLRNMKTAFDHQGIAYIGLTGITNVDEGLHKYRHIMEVLAPETIAIVRFSLGENINDTSQIGIVYDKFLEISKEYAERMWG